MQGRCWDFKSRKQIEKNVFFFFFFFVISIVYIVYEGT